MNRRSLDYLKGRCDIDDASGCWHWRSPRTRGGYGVVKIEGVAFYVHRLAHELAIGPIPDGHQIDHLCRVRECMNPGHLEAVTPRENNLRGIGLAAQRARMTQCPRGHEFTPDNTYSRPDRTGSRMCRTCCQLRESRRERRSA